jgi:hypothetical protein
VVDADIDAVRIVIGGFVLTLVAAGFAVGNFAGNCWFNGLTRS